MAAEEIAREIASAPRPVAGYWRFQECIQILPAPPEAPRPPQVMAEHPFVLEVAFTGSVDPDMKKQNLFSAIREATLLLSALTHGPIRELHRDRSTRQMWATPLDGEPIPRWSSETYFVAGFHGLSATMTNPVDVPRLPSVDQHAYYELRAPPLDDNLHLPDSLTADFEKYFSLPPQEKEAFQRSAYWLRHAQRVQPESVSAGFVALVTAIEALLPVRDEGRCPECKRPLLSISRQFREFVELLLAEWSIAGQVKQDIYDTRSKIAHGSQLLLHDTRLGLDMPKWSEFERLHSAWRAARLVAVEWLRRFPDVTPAPPPA